MAKKVYIGQSDLARKVNKIYLGIDGKARKVVKGYVGVNGVARQFWPELILYYWNKYNTITTNRYYWNRYNVIETTYYKWKRYSSSTQTIYKWNKFTTVTTTFRETYDNARALFINNSNNNQTVSYISFGPGAGDDHGTETLSPGERFPGSSGTYVQYEATVDSYTVNSYGSYTTITGTWEKQSTGAQYHIESAVEFGESYSNVVHVSGPKETSGEFVESVTSANYDEYPQSGKHTDGYFYFYMGEEEQQIQGSYIDDVESTNNSAYPQNGISGSYWYEYDSFRVEYGRGSANGSVNSTNRSQYPDNDRSGNYWYVYNRQTISYSQGSYIGVVQSENPSAYPSNGRHTDGYWYVKQ